MVSLDKALIAYLDKGGVRFEIYVDPDEALKLRLGEQASVQKALVTDEIFKDVKKGERHTAGALEKAFGTADPLTIAQVIIKEGEVPFTTEQKRKMTEVKLNKVIEIILRESIDPRTNAPLTRVRIENALEKVRVHIEPFKDAESQVDDVVKALRMELPIKFKRVKVAVKFPSEFAQRAYGIVKNYNIQKEEWTNKGELVVLVEIPAGIQGEFYDKINKLTHGNVETKIVE